MHTITFCFSGWISGLNVDRVTNNETGMETTVSHISKERLIEMLNNKEVTIDFVAALRDANDFTVELFDFDESK